MSRKLWLVLLSVLLLVGAMSAPAQAQQTTVVWTTEFYNNLYLIGSPVATRTDATLAFNWGGGSPMTGVNADNFTARITGGAFFPAGTYRFTLVADDAVKLRVGTFERLSTFGDPKPGEQVSVDVTLEAKVHQLQVDYREFEGDAYVYLAWTNLATGETFGVLPADPAAPTAPVSGGPWLAEYYNNADLAGSPSAIFNESSPAHTWGFAAPLTNINADFFSARWTRTQFLNAGTYRVSARGDDGVRVRVNGVTYIDQWALYNPNTQTADFTLLAGDHTFVVEYREFSGEAFIEFSLDQLTGTTPITPVTPAGATATVTAGRLNVRNAPSVITGSILTKINNGETYAIVGRNPDASWWQINVNGLIGWVSAPYTNAFNVAGVPVTSAQTPQQQTLIQPTANTAVTQGQVNMRTGPGINNSRIAIIPQGRTVQIIGRNTDATWWQVDYNGLKGWVSAAWAEAQPGTNINTIPVTS